MKKWPGAVAVALAALAAGTWFALRDDASPADDGYVLVATHEGQEVWVLDTVNDEGDRMLQYRSTGPWKVCGQGGGPLIDPREPDTLIDSFILCGESTPEGEGLIIAEIPRDATAATAEIEPGGAQGGSADPDFTWDPVALTVYDTPEDWPVKLAVAGVRGAGQQFTFERVNLS